MPLPVRRRLARALREAADRLEQTGPDEKITGELCAALATIMCTPPFSMSESEAKKLARESIERTLQSLRKAGVVD